MRVSYLEFVFLYIFWYFRVIFECYVICRGMKLFENVLLELKIFVDYVMEFFFWLICNIVVIILEIY